jgi:hypothetical protein
MNQYQKKQFIIDLLKINEGINSKDRKPIDDFCNSFMDSIAENSPKENFDHSAFEQLRKVSMSDMIKHLESVKPESGIFDRMFGNIEKYIKTFEGADPINHQGQSFDPKSISDKYNQSKDKFLKHSESQDIKNL